MRSTDDNVLRPNWQQYQQINWTNFRYNVQCLPCEGLLHQYFLQIYLFTLYSNGACSSFALLVNISWSPIWTAWLHLCINYLSSCKDDSLYTWWPSTAFCFCWRASIILLYLRLFVGCGEAECGSSMRLY